MMVTTRSIELLAPAKDLAIGIEAVLHGADAVYIGAPKFGARVNAGNSIDDIRKLCEFAHLYHTRVYVALNTILTDTELKEAEGMIRQIYEAGADALIIQDMGITQLDLPPMPLHASTQTDNCTPEKVDFLHKTGFSRIILARELTLKEIKAISKHVPQASLEAFIHGSLCVSYSGRCYLSYALNGRSANRGECAQCCRLPYSLVDADGEMIINQKHLLSLRDLNRSDDLEALLKAGISSFKIEGRLKDASYVKNIVAWYRKKLDRIIAKNPSYDRSSHGASTYTFEPQPEKSFNRGFTPYMLHGRNKEITSFDTPKSIGEPVGVVKEIKGNSFTVAGLKPIHNGDGLVFFNSHGDLEGFRVNRAEANRIYPQKMPQFLPKTPLFRNYDHAFETLLSKPSAERKIGVGIEWSDYPEGFTLTITDDTEASATISRPFAKDISHRLQEELIKNQLGKLGGTPFMATNIIISMSDRFFAPSSLLNEMRREAVEELIAVRRHKCLFIKRNKYDNDVVYPLKSLDYTANVSNIKAQEFYQKHQAEVLQPAFEQKMCENVPLMYTKHCLRFSMGWCPVYQKKQSLYKEPFYLIHKDVRLLLSFDCQKCQMTVFKIE
jgi:putative protease